MATLEERVACLEGRGEEHAAAISEVRQDVRDVRTDVRDLRTEMNRRFDQMDAKFDGRLGRRTPSSIADAKFDGRLGQMDARLDRMDAKFAWLIGFQFATMLAVIGALLKRVPQVIRATLTAASRVPSTTEVSDRLPRRIPLTKSSFPSARILKTARLAGTVFTVAPSRTAIVVWLPTTRIRPAGSSANVRGVKPRVSMF